jgi:uncharacterized protein (TIGR03118 family)
MLPVAAFVAALLLAATFSSVLPISFARMPANTRTNRLQGPKVAIPTGTYRQSNLVSDLPGVALIEDRLLKNPWGVALNDGSPFWVANNQTDCATLYRGDVSGSPLVRYPALPSVSINGPTLQPMPVVPTGVVSNTTSDFPIPQPTLDPPAPAQFIFSTANGAINAWGPALGSTTFVAQFVPGHIYTGLAIGSNASGNVLYVADFANGKIDVFDKNFNPTSVSGNFTDATIPANFHAYNIQNLSGALYVSYAIFQNGMTLDTGFVRKFDTNGVRDAAFAINNIGLADPWGMVVAPASFGAFSNMLLVGNAHTLGVHDSSIHAFNPATGALLGYMVDEGGALLEIKGLRGLVFGNGTNGGDPNTLYFAGGITEETLADGHGVFGSLKPAAALPASTIKFSSGEYHTTENAGHIDITVTRSGDTSGTATVNYATVDGSASQKSQYEIALGKLIFNPGDTSKTFRVLIVDNNSFAAGTSRQLDLVLSNSTGAALISPNVAELFIMDDEFDTPRQPPNIVDDTQFFVRQQYFDFLNREPDAAGLNFWTNQILSCGTDQQCIELKRINVSAAFFLSLEFQKTGMLAYLTERGATGAPPRYGPFMRDVQALQKDYVFGAPGASEQLESNIKAFFNEFVTRPEFVAAYGGLSNRDYVDNLFSSGGINGTTARLFIFGLDSSQPVPPSNSASFGTGIARTSFATSQVVDFSLSFRVTSAETASHIHGPALAGSTAPAIVTLPNGEFRDFTVTLTIPQVHDMDQGRLYIDVHTANFPEGEIRGQIPVLRFQRDVLVNALDHGYISRAEALRLTVEDVDYRQKEFNRAFVLMEYFGYLRRNPNDPPDNNLDGYNFWLNKLNQFNGNFVSSEMVKAFIKSTEYRGRFGPP